MTTTTTTDKPTPDPEDRHVVLYAVVDGETRVFVQCGQTKHLVDAHEVLRLIISAELDDRSAVDVLFEHFDGIAEWVGPDHVFAHQRT